MERWSAGTVVVRREVWRGRPWLANPLWVVDDTDDVLVLYRPEGSPWGFGAGDDWPTATGRHPYDGRTAWVGEGPLGLHRSGDPFAVWAQWGGPDRTFLGWYVNLQVPYRRTPIGIDSLDLELDLLVTPELEVVLKDEDHVDESAALGRFTAEDAAAIHALGADVKRRIETDGAWWDESWSAWSPPPPLFEPPQLRADWETIPTAPVASLLAPPLPRS